jgi:hypothetical protein
MNHVLFGDIVTLGQPCIESLQIMAKTRKGASKNISSTLYLRALLRRVDAIFQCSP